MAPNTVTPNLQRSPENPLDKERKVEIDAISRIYKPEDHEYLTFIQTRLQSAKTARSTPLPEWGGGSYDTVFLTNEAIANTWLEPKKNEDDVIVASGTVEAKLDALLANIANLNLEPEVHAFDKNNNELVDFAQALTDAIYVTEEHDGNDEGGDEEKKLLRQRELLKQGTVFVQEEWLKLSEIKKKLTKKYDGQFKDFDAWTEKLECVFEGPGRTLLYGPNVYLGNMFEYHMDKQPYVFAVIQQDYSVAKAKYGKFENWQYVIPGMAPAMMTQGLPGTIYQNNWRLTDLKKDQVEIVLYQDQTRDEFQIIINGVMMLPIGFPLSAVVPGGKYNITKQVYKPIHGKFAYGKAFVALGSIKYLSYLIDEMLRLFVLKTRKSFSPSYINTSGRVISPRVLTPGRITMGIPAGALQPIGQESNGVTKSEFEVLKELQTRVDQSTVSNQFMGQQGSNESTATEVLELQRQAKLVLGLTIAACSFLEKKLTYLRVWNLMANWFKAVDSKIEIDQDGNPKKTMRYRNTNRAMDRTNPGMGRRMVMPVDGELPTADVIWFQQYEMSKAEKAPVTLIYLSPEKLQAAQVSFYVTIVPKEKETSALMKLMFREEMGDMLALMQIGSKPNVAGFEDKFAQAWGGNRSKLFMSEAAGQTPLSPSLAGPEGEVGPDMGGVSTALQSIASRGTVPQVATGGL